MAETVRQEQADGRWATFKRRFKSYFKDINQPIFFVSLLLILIGIVAVYSASSYQSLVASKGATSLSYTIRQIFYAIVGLIIMLLTYRLRTDSLRFSWIRKAIVIVITLLMVIVQFTPPVNGARGWINIGIGTIQPVEFMKPAVVILWADYLTRHRQDLAEKGFWRTIQSDLTLPLIFAVWLFLTIRLPDMGGVLLVLIILFCMTLGSGISLKHTLRWVGLILVAYFGLVLILKHFDFSALGQNSYQLERIVSFVNPFKDAKGAGHQLVNSYYALARGGLFGVGPGNSIEKLGYLPEAHNDFIMAIVAEETGLVGVLIILVLYFFLIFYMLYRAKKIHQPYYKLLLIGVAAYFLAQAIVNLGGITGLIPITGVTFPFISYGGSSMIVSEFMIGLALSVERNSQLQIRHRGRRRPPRKA